MRTLRQQSKAHSISKLMSLMEPVDMHLKLRMRRKTTRIVAWMTMWPLSMYIRSVPLFTVVLNHSLSHNVGNDAQTSHSSAPQRAHTTSRYQEIDNTQDTVVASTDARTVIPIVEIPLVPSPSRVRTRTARNREQTQAVRSHASIRQRPQTKPPRSSGECQFISYI